MVGFMGFGYEWSEIRRQTCVKYITESPIASERDLINILIVSAGEGWGEGFTQIAYFPSLSLSRDLESYFFTISFAGEGTVLPGLLLCSLNSPMVI